MSWNLKHVGGLLNRYYPAGFAWEAVVPEGEFDIGLDDELTELQDRLE